MNEDDTFRVLKRIPFSELWRLYTEYYRANRISLTSEDIKIFCEKYGWELEDARCEEDRRRANGTL